MRRAALAVCAALAVAAPAAADSLVHVDPPRPRGSELPALPRGPVPPFGGATGASSHAIGCPRETLFTISRILAFLDALPLGEAWVDLATPEFQGFCG